MGGPWLVFVDKSLGVDGRSIVQEVPSEYLVDSIKYEEIPRWKIQLNMVVINEVDGGWIGRMVRRVEGFNLVSQSSKVKCVSHKIQARKTPGSRSLFPIWTWAE
jgi:hypothetical protein